MSDKLTLTAPGVTPPAEQVRVFDAAAPHFREVGICSTCVHRAGCLYLQSARRPVAFCEEFDDGGTAGRDQAQRLAEIPRAAVNFGEAQAIGICSACESRTSCVYRQPGVAIWDCEEYR